jgi:hypothetical protein
MSIGVIPSPFAAAKRPKYSTFARSPKIRSKERFSRLQRIAKLSLPT